MKSPLSVWHGKAAVEHSCLQVSYNFPTVKMFVRSSTSIPSSATVERPFYVGRDVFGLKWAKLTDGNFEKKKKKKTPA